MVKLDTTAKPEKLLAVTVVIEPGGPDVGETVTIAPGISWLALALATKPVTVLATTLFVEGIDPVSGTLKLTLKAPVWSGEALATTSPE